mmetsp:Transcript_19574/g.36168  ORF Transcript_19574/g.36168 Transcript_19574/m.36168 type:complete len:218 (-) Transcript_19574:272-925(-)
MGVQRIERSVAKRLSLRVEHLVNRVVPNKRKGDDGVRVSELKSTRGPALKECNALNSSGVAIIRQIAEEVSARIKDETGVNEQDMFTKDTAPPVAIFDYFSRLARYINVWRGHSGGAESAGVRAAVMAMVYLDRLMNTGYTVNSMNVHRLAMVGFLLATKMTEDTPIGNQFWAKVGGVPNKEVNLLEREFCRLINFELHIDENEYLHMLDQFNLPEF